MFRSWKEVFKTRSMCHCYIIKGSFSLWSNEISIWKGGSIPSRYVLCHDSCACLPVFILILIEFTHLLGLNFESDL